MLDKKISLNKIEAAISNKSILKLSWTKKGLFVKIIYEM